MAKKYENIENIGKLISEGAVAELSKKVSGAEKSASDILKKLNDLEAAIRQKKFDEEQAALKAAEEEAAAKRAAEVKAQPAEEPSVLEQKPEKVEEKPAE
ncbi:MAG: hypothetical protein K2L42_01685, partial [Clostridia bacterium]|nr:hypothetical protein [Clostridia bacterium]